MVICQRLRAAHLAQARGEDELAFERAPTVLPGQRAEGFVRALQDALRADVDPAARGHLAEHDQALALPLVEVFLRGPMRHDVGVGDQHTRGVSWVRKTATGLPDWTINVSSGSRCAGIARIAS